MLLDLLFPKFCLNCNKHGAYLCLSCSSQIVRHKQTCIICHQITPHGKTHSECQKHSNINGIIIATNYHSLVKKAIHKIKYNLSYDILDELLTKTLLSQNIKNSLIQEKIDLATEIPTSKQKLKTRGFNQSEMISQWITKNYNISHASLLRKKFHTPSQAQLSRQDRLFNLVDAFELLPNQNKLVENKNILLVDDITTTSQTLEECAKVLKKHKANNVWALVIASSK